MKFTLGIALNPLDQLIELARSAEECGFSSIALPDSIFFRRRWRPITRTYRTAGASGPARRQQAEAGVTDAIVVPWLLYGAGFDVDLRLKKDGLRRFADEIIAVMEGE